MIHGLCFSPILQLDTLGIYGSHIWILYSDVCGRDVRKLLALLRAVQLGLLSATTIQAASQAGEEIVFDLSAVVKLVEDRLPDFQRASAQPSAEA